MTYTKNNILVVSLIGIMEICAHAQHVIFCIAYLDWEIRRIKWLSICYPKLGCQPKTSYCTFANTGMNLGSGYHLEEVKEAYVKAEREYQVTMMSGPCLHHGIVSSTYCWNMSLLWHWTFGWRIPKVLFTGHDMLCE